MSIRPAAVITGLSWLLTVASFILLAVVETSGVEDNLFHYQDAAVGLVFPALGWLVLRQVGSHPVGWILVVAGLSGALGVFAEEYVTVGVAVYPATLPAVRLVAWFGSWTWAFFFASLPVLLMLYPDGRLPSARWRPLLWLAGAPIVVLPGLLAVSTWSAPLETIADSGEPGFPPLLETLFAGSVVLLAVALLGALVSLAIRWRTNSGIIRQQLKVFFLCAAAGVTCLVMSQLQTPFRDVLGVLAFLLVPAGMVAAILRYRLYDIDRIVSRTVSYALVSALLIGLYLALVLALQQILPANNDLATAASTLAAVAAFNPLRRRVQAVVDRRFNRSRYDAESTVEQFARSLRTEATVGTLRHGLESAVATTLEPSHISVWLKGATG